MHPVGQRSAFTLRQLLAAVMILAALMAVALPRLVWKREAARREECVQKLHQIGIGLQNHHDSFKNFPKVSTKPFPQTPGGPNAGFSWLWRTMPYIEERSVYKPGGFRPNFPPIKDGGVSVFHPSVKTPSGQHLSMVQVPDFVCPSFSGPPISDVSARSPYAAALASFAPSSPGTAKNPPQGIAISSYVAIPATDIARMQTVTPTFNSANGVIVPCKGLNLRAITDGTSNTIIACETRERSLNAWIDGSVNWVVGADPNNSAAPANDSLGLIALPAGAGTALNVGPGNPMAKTRYLALANSPNGYEWAWGPSSEHSGVVMHGYADASVRVQSEKIDPTVYLRLITRAGNDPVVDPAKN